MFAFQDKDTGKIAIFKTEKERNVFVDEAYKYCMKKFNYCDPEKEFVLEDYVLVNPTVEEFYK